MRIIASKKDEILRRKAEYDEAMSNYNSAYDAASKNFSNAVDAVLMPIRHTLESVLQQYTSLDFEVRVERTYRDSVRVMVECNRNRIFENTNALSWDYDALLDVSTGELKRATSAWSGLKAVTEDQMTSLRQTVAALEYLNSVDWAALLNVTLPEYNEFFDDLPERPQTEDFNAQLIQAELSELVGTGKLIKVHPWGESCPYRGDLWVQISGETAAQYRVIPVPNYIVESGDESIASYLRYAPMRVKKSNLQPVQPWQIREI